MMCEKCSIEKEGIKIKVFYATPENDGWEEIFSFCSLECLIVWIIENDQFSLHDITIKKGFLDIFDIKKFKQWWEAR